MRVLLSSNCNYQINYWQHEATGATHAHLTLQHRTFGQQQRTFRTLTRQQCVSETVVTTTTGCETTVSQQCRWFAIASEPMHIKAKVIAIILKLFILIIPFLYKQQKSTGGLRRDSSQIGGKVKLNCPNFLPCISY